MSSIDGIHIQLSADLRRVWFIQIFAVPSNEGLLLFFLSCPNILPWSFCYRIRMCLFNEGRSNMFLVKIHFNTFIFFCLWPPPSFFLPVYVYHSLTVQTLFWSSVLQTHSLATSKFTFGAFLEIFFIKKIRAVVMMVQLCEFTKK